MSQLFRRVAAALVAVTTLLVVPAPVEAAPPAPAPLDCADWRYGPDDEPASLPGEYDRDDYRLTSRRDTNPALHDSPQNHCGQKGAAVDLAWGLSTGSPEVLIAVLDSGIKWRDAGAMADLAAKTHINIGEAPPPCIGTEPDGDCDGDGVVTILDFGPITDRNGNGVADPQDLILDPAVSDGVDDDGDGYVDNISGWDFLYGDNDPFDTVDYGHGTGEALDSTAAANGTGNVGTCPQCMHLPVRVSDSFIADGGRFAAGVLYALDEGADVVQEALGAVTNPRQAQQAIDAAYARGVVVVASMADEASSHPNLSSSLERTMTVNSVTEKAVDLLGPAPVEGYLALNGCTNFGGRTFVSVPSSACSSEATGLSAGMVGLAESHARAVGLDPHPSLAGLDGRHAGDVLSANEVMQLVRASADDIDFATPNAVDPANSFGTPSGNPLIDTVRYPTRPGWDAIHGYGRINAYELLRLIEPGRCRPRP
ncbi:MAG TPA: S8 family serine peptidase [Iamia sp.]|nr:S8 family serine peptidase [Iamia sp.]